MSFRGPHTALDARSLKFKQITLVSHSPIAESIFFTAGELVLHRTS
jgi:hypothetical protein